MENVRDDKRKGREEMNRKAAAVLVGVMTASILTGCGTGDSGTETTSKSEADATTSATEEESTSASKSADDTEQTKILVAAAASLKNVYDDELIPMFQDNNPKIVVEGTYDASGKLQTQIEEGLEADIFMSAAPKQMNDLNDKSLIETDTMTDLLENKIVLIVPSTGDSGITKFEDIANASSIAIGDPASVPVGQYSQEALTNLGIWDNIQDKLSLGTNVTEVLNQVAAKSADAGIVYATDAASMPDKVKVVAEAPKDSVSKAIYPVAVIKDSKHREEAKAFVDFLKTPEAIKVFEDYGFTDALSQ